MSTKLSRLPASSQEATRERRQHPRHPASATVIVRSSHGEDAAASLVDVSSHGCCIKCEAAWLKAGSFVSIAVGDNPALQAIVRWVRHDAAGTEFLRSIPPERTEWHKLTNSPFVG